jgi:hypothetical protein
MLLRTFGADPGRRDVAVLAAAVAAAGEFLRDSAECGEAGIVRREKISLCEHGLPLVYLQIGHPADPGDFGMNPLFAGAGGGGAAFWIFCGPAGAWLG